MTDKEFKRLSRSQLIEIIYHFQLKQDELIAENERLTKELEDKRLRVAQAGNIAEAALAVNNVMQSAQNAAQQYLDEIRAMHAELDEECKNIRRKATEEADEIIARARKEAAAINKGRARNQSTATVREKKAAAPEQKVKKTAAVSEKTEKTSAVSNGQVLPKKTVTAAKAAPKGREDALLEEILSEFGSGSDMK